MDSRHQLWIDLINKNKIGSMLELGVWRGHFAEAILRKCPSIKRYYMLDPWRHLSNWDKPLNVSEVNFEEVYQEALARTGFAADRRVILRGTTIEMLDQIPDASLGLAYVDGDHSLRGIAIDLIRVYDKVQHDGFVGGDDLEPSVWTHGPNFEPTLVFPFAIYFAEAKGKPIAALGHHQFAIAKGGSGFGFNGAADYPSLALRAHMAPLARPVWRRALGRIKRLVRR